jgi:hypothetical protein
VHSISESGKQKNKSQYSDDEYGLCYFQPINPKNDHSFFKVNKQPELSG